MNRTLTVKEIAEKLDITEYWVRVLAREGKIPGTKKGHEWRFNWDEVQVAFFVDNSFTK